MYENIISSIYLFDENGESYIPEMFKSQDDFNESLGIVNDYTEENQSEEVLEISCEEFMDLTKGNPLSSILPNSLQTFDIDLLKFYHNKTRDYLILKDVPENVLYIYL